jgi:hypothetical protein
VTGTLDLREVFPFLNSVSHLSTNLFKNLRVVIEYVPNNAHHLLLNSQVPADVTGIAKVTPILICDEITDDALASALDKKMSGASWIAIEHDLANIPQPAGFAAADTPTKDTIATQRVQLRMNGFQNKAVSRMMVAKCYEDTSATGPNVIQPAAKGPDTVKALGGYGSKALLNEKFNVRLNGRSVLAGEGLVSPAQQTMMLSDTWGALAMTPFANQQSVGLDTVYNNYAATPVGPENVTGITQTVPNVKSTAPGAGEAQHGPWISNSAFIGIPIHDRITDLQLDFGRTCTYSDGTTSSAGNFQSINLHCFMEVSKAMSVSGGSYRVFYS